MYALWFMVYWGTIITGSVFMKFYKIYWASGRFSIKSKFIFTCKSLLIRIIILIIIIVAIGFALIKFYGNSVLESISTTILIISNVYGMIVLVTLLAHSLIKLPIFMWKFSDNNYNLINSLSRAERVRR